jgi:hypothetical protein
VPDTTPLLGFPYPEGSDAPDGPSQIGALALAVDTEVYAANARLSKNASQSIAHNTLADVTWPVEDADDDALHVAAAATITVSKAGLYLVNAMISWAANATGTRQAYLDLSGVVRDFDSQPAASGIETLNRLCYIAQLSAASTVKVQGFQNSGGALNVTGGHIEVARLGS